MDTMQSAETSLGTPVFRARGLTKVYDMGEIHVHALRGVDLELYHSELMVLLGPSGSGKSTLVNILGGLDTATSGEVFYGDTELTAADDRALTKYRRRHVGFIFQFYNLISSLTARENVAVVTEIAEAPMDPAEALELVGLEERLDHFPAQMSGGEQQRVAIARALASEPLLLLADEPTGNLDDRATRGIMDLFWKINAVGMTVLMATHDLELMNRHPNARVLELDQGRLVYDSGDEKPAASGEQRSPRPASGMSPVLGGEPDVDPEREPAREPELDRGSDLALEPKLGREPEPAQETGN